MLGPGAIVGSAFVVLMQRSQRGGAAVFAAYPMFVIWLLVAFFVPLYVASDVARRRLLRPKRSVLVVPLATAGLVLNVAVLACLIKWLRT
jgi:hypothetical protein